MADFGRPEYGGPKNHAGQKLSEDGRLPEAAHPFPSMRPMRRRRINSAAKTAMVCSGAKDPTLFQPRTMTAVSADADYLDTLWQALFSR